MHGIRWLLVPALLVAAGLPGHGEPPARPDLLAFYYPWYTDGEIDFAAPAVMDLLLPDLGYPKGRYLDTLARWKAGR